MTRVLLVSHEELRHAMSGWSIRNWELATALSGENQVTLAAPGTPARRSSDFDVVGYNREHLPALVGAHEVAICSGFLLHENPSLMESPYLVVDLYAPFELESLHQFEERSQDERLALGRGFRQVIAEQIHCGDFFLCASERQKDFWLGWMDANDRVSVTTHVADPSFDSLIGVVPFGLPDQPPEPGRPRLRGVLRGIDEDSLLVLWGGGIWNWFDPLTLIRAAHATRDTLPHLRVVFPSSSSPSEMVPAMHMAKAARRLSDELELTGSRVFFGESWVPYEERGALFKEADIGISLHRNDIETRFSFRTRVVDYLWAGLPVVTTRGDSMADLVESKELGAVVDYEDVDSLAQALVKLADPARRRDAAERSAAAAGQFRWTVAAGPLLEFCRSPRQAPDRDAARAGAKPAEVDPALRGSAEFFRISATTIRTLRHGGLAALFKKSDAYLRRRRVRARKL